MGEVIGGILGGVGSIGGAIIQARAAEEARKQALTGYNYLTEGPGKKANNAFINYGRRGIADANTARAAQMELLGLTPAGGGAPTGEVAPDGTGGPMPPGPGMPRTGGSIPPSLTGGSTPGTIRNYFNRPNDARVATGPRSGIAAPTISMTKNPSGRYALSPTGGDMAPMASPPGTGGPMLPPATAGAVPAAAAPGGAGNAFKNYLNSTGYQFQLGEGQDAITTSAAARGLLRSGGTAKALTKYGQDLASTTFNNYLSQLGNVGSSGANAGITGQNQLGMVTNAGTGAGSNAGGYIMEGGNAWAQGLGGGLGSIANIFANLG